MVLEIQSIIQKINLPSGNDDTNDEGGGGGTDTALHSLNSQAKNQFYKMNCMVLHVILQ